MDLAANPHFYDYLHDIRLAEDGTCEFNDGGGQRINYVLKGTYKKDDEKKLFIFNMSLANHAYKDSDADNKKESKIVQFQVPFVLENGLFVLKQEVVWNEKEETWPYSIFTQRYVFKTDPHALLQTDPNIQQTIEDNLYTWVSGIEKDHLHIHYNMSTYMMKRFNELTPAELAVLRK